MSFVGSELQPRYESRLQALGLGDVVTAYRRFPGGRSNIDFAWDVFRHISSRSDCVACCLDIRDFFPSIRHSPLKKAWREVWGSTTLPRHHYLVYRAMSRWNHVPVIDVLLAKGRGKHALRRWPPGKPLVESMREFRTIVVPLIRRGWSEVEEPAGIPQGAPISGLLANVFMLDIDHSTHQLANSLGVMYRRYSDDIVLVGPTIEAVRAVVDHLTVHMATRGLEHEPGKASWHHFITTSDGGAHECSPTPMQYLGFTFDGRDVLLRSQTIARSIRRMKSGVRRAKEATRAAAVRSEERASLWRRDLFDRYSWQGLRHPACTGTRSTFSGYARRAVLTLNSEAIRRQLRGQQARLESEIALAEGEMRRNHNTRRSRGRR